MLTPGHLTVKGARHKTPMFVFPTSARQADQTDLQIPVSDARDVIQLFRSSHLSGRDPSMRCLYYIRMVGHVKGNEYFPFTLQQNQGQITCPAVSPWITFGELTSTR